MTDSPANGNHPNRAGGGDHVDGAAARVGPLTGPERTWTTTDVRPIWKASRQTIRLAAVAALALIAAIVTGRPELVVVAAPCLAAVVLAVHRPRPASVRVSISMLETRCFETDELDVEVRVDADVRLGEISVRPVLSRAFEVDEPGPRQAYRSRQLVTTWKLHPTRWGRWTVGPIRIGLRTAGLGYVGEVELEAGELTVFPPPARARDVAVPPVLLDRLGNHVARRRGQGVEFAEIRAYAPGDPVRRINWAVSARRSDLYVNTFAAERAADVVAVVDTTVDVGPRGRSSLDLSVRGAAGVVQAYLRYADRVGVVSVGGTIRWLRPDVGTRQYYRIVETLLVARRDDSFCEPELAHLPPQALPPGALAFVFTPLLDPRAIEVIRDLRERGHPVVVVDVLSTEHAPGRLPEGQLALRIWRLERGVLVHGLTEMGAAVVDWDEEQGVPLDRVRLEPLLRGGRTR